MSSVEERLTAGVAAIRASRHGEARDLIASCAVEGRRDRLQVKVHSLLAQALLGLDELDGARDAIRAALSIAADIGDVKAHRPLTNLREEISRAIAARSAMASREATLAAIRARSLEEALEGVEGGDDRVTRALEKANAHVDGGEHEEGRRIAELALEMVTDDMEHPTRHRVIAMLCLARTDPASAGEHLERARDLADRENEHNLITAVAQAAKATGYTFETWTF